MPVKCWWSRLFVNSQKARYIIGVVLALWLISYPGLADPFAQVKNAVEAYVDDHLMTDGLLLLEETVNINSGTMNFAGIRKTARVFEQELTRLGFETRWVSLESVNRAGHLYAEYKGDNAVTTILLIGHLDTVFESNSPFQKFERLDTETVKGPGVFDMKGGIVQIIIGLKALEYAGALENLHIILALMGDEESAGRDPDGRWTTSRGSLVEVAKRSDYALAFEGVYGGDPSKITIARRGIAVWELEVSTNSGHSSQVFSSHLGPGAIYPAAMVMNGFYKQLKGSEYLTFNPGIFVGGATVAYDANQIHWQVTGKKNIIAGHAKVIGDIRYMTSAQLEETSNRMHSIARTTQASLRHEYPELDTPVTVKLKVHPGKPTMEPRAGNMRLLKRLSKINNQLTGASLEPLDPAKRGAADISFVAVHVDGCLDGLGPVGSGAHSQKETMDLRTLPLITKRSALLIYDLSTVLDAKE